jgi:hypothetical protein
MIFYSDRRIFFLFFNCSIIFPFYSIFRSAQLNITLANEGQEAYKPELYGKEIQIIRKIGSRQSSYKILGKI